jgi:CRP-like cAMP-binding protein
MSPHTQPTDNHLLAALPESVLRRWQLQLQPVSLDAGQVLYELGSRPVYVYFPTTAVVALMVGSQDDGSIEVALVGNEGLVGSALFLGSQTMPCRALVQCAGTALRMTTQCLLDEFERSPSVRHLLLRYAQALMTQMAQAAVCNRHHSIEKRLCYWLLMTLDRLGEDELTMTQDLIAHNLGVRREGVTESAHHLQELGLIRYSRGHIRVLDREGIERHACECYATVSRECGRLLPEPVAA